jgi:hypothetical protein
MLVNCYHFRPFIPILFVVLQIITKARHKYENPKSIIRDSDDPLSNESGVSGCQPKESATIYAVDGKQVQTTQVNGDGMAR